METGTKELVICSAYFPGDTMFPPPNEVRKLVAFCRGKNLQLLVACDANSHHTTWGSTDINERGHCRLRAHLKKLKILHLSLNLQIWNEYYKRDETILCRLLSVPSGNSNVVYSDRKQKSNII
ncbi:uncharacterized protein LOC123316850 [Coccinella septempunctata]|uniref:uncharacterized protein LOC123316850 n=1 Tax=Coccinella septempunctata TaxID=41139 RepID=UPI001D0613D0|nr:uncharacterized protein LOC123316850 [Coccinella septempunctata]